MIFLITFYFVYMIIACTTYRHSCYLNLKKEKKLSFITETEIQIYYVCTLKSVPKHLR